MSTKRKTKSMHEFRPTVLRQNSRLEQRRLYELDRNYLRQLRRLSQIVWNAKLKHGQNLSKAVSNPLDDQSVSNTASQPQKTP